MIFVCRPAEPLGALVTFPRPRVWSLAEALARAWAVPSPRCLQSPDFVCKPGLGCPFRLPLRIKESDLIGVLQSANPSSTHHTIVCYPSRQARSCVAVIEVRQPRQPRENVLQHVARRPLGDRAKSGESERPRWNAAQKIKDRGFLRLDNSMPRSQSPDSSLV